MDRLVSVNSLERYAVVLENGHSEHTDGSLDREFLDLKNLRFLLQRRRGEDL